MLRFRAYIHHHSQIVQLEQRLFRQNLLNSDCNVSLTMTNLKNSNETNTNISSSSSTSISSQQDKNDRVKSITEELQKKIDSKQPLLFPPKDYDTLHVDHGNIQRAQAWKSTEVKNEIRQIQ